MKQLRGWWAVVRKELTIYFGTPIFYITGFFRSEEHTSEL